MASPQRLWRIGVVFAFLWMRSFDCSSEVDNSSPINTHDLHKRYIANNGNYEVIDVMSHDGQKDNGQNGQTMRILTTGDVGDDFWLKYLGEDFRHAIHLQVGQHDDVYKNAVNTTQQRYRNSEAPNKIPVEENLSANYEKAVKEEESQKQNKTMESKAENLPKASLDNETEVTSSNEAKELEEQPISENKGKSTNSKTVNQKYKKVQLNEKTKPIKNLGKESKRKHKKVESESHESPFTPVVVNLPDSKKSSQEYDKGETPVVVKMPPVIYHQHTAAYSEEDKAKADEDSQRSYKTHQHTYSHNYQNTHTHNQPTHNTEPQYPQYYRPQPHQSHKSYQSHQNHQTHEPQHLPQNQPLEMHQHQHQHQSQMYSQYNTGVYNTPPFEETSRSGSAGYRFSEMMNADTSSRYMMDKSPGSYDPSTGYSRVGRSNQELFQQGL